jgi:hypothetical protein
MWRNERKMHLSLDNAGSLHIDLTYSIGYSTVMRKRRDMKKPLGNVGKTLRLFIFRYFRNRGILISGGEKCVQKTPYFLLLLVQ